MSGISYASETRPDTGLYNAKLGLWLFIASEVMLFGALYSSYVFLRTANPGWASATATLPVHLSFLNLFCTFSAAAASAQAWATLRSDHGGRPGRWLAISVVLGIVSVLLISLEHRAVAQQGIHAATSNYYGMYYLLTGLQRLHVAALSLFGLWTLLSGRRLMMRDALRFTNRLECYGLIWQLLAVLWVVFMLLFYVMG